MATAKTIMTRKLLTLFPDTPVSEAIKVLEKERLTGAPVVDESGKLVGVVSFKDLIRAVDSTARGAPDFYLRWPAALTALQRIEGGVDLFVRYVMSEEPITVDFDAPLEDVARCLVEHQIHRVLVTDADELVGLISALDFARLYAPDREPATG